MEFKKIVVFLIIAIIIVISSIFIINRGNSSDESNNDGLKTIYVSEVTRSVFYAPQYVAIANGYFEENGLKIDFN